LNKTFLFFLQETLKSLRAVCGVAFSRDATSSKKEMGSDRREGTHHVRRSESSSEEEEWTIIVQGTLILTVADTVNKLFFDVLIFKV
ncbi:hypothetical protein MKX01_041756, partial [Papaver californicum]